MLDNIVKKSSGKKKPSSLIVMILQYTKNLQLIYFLQHNDIGNFKIVQLLLYSKDFFKCKNSFFKLRQNNTFSPKNTKEF